METLSCHIHFHFVFISIQFWRKGGGLEYLDITLTWEALMKLNQPSLPRLLPHFRNFVTVITNTDTSHGYVIRGQNNPCREFQSFPFFVFFCCCCYCFNYLFFFRDWEIYSTSIGWINTHQSVSCRRIQGRLVVRNESLFLVMGGFFKNSRSFSVHFNWFFFNNLLDAIRILRWNTMFAQQNWFLTNQSHIEIQSLQLILSDSRLTRAVECRVRPVMAASIFPTMANI